jgi:BirA family biotin operon repressor/biotin-[acetyl-CoA-carboxylase] ligase
MTYNEQMLPDLLTEASIRSSLTTAILGRRVTYLSTTASTMDDARQAALEGAPEGTLVLAEEQTSGTGRFQRTWVSPPGVNLYLSLVLRPEPVALPQLGMMASLALARALHRLAPEVARPTIKWPNDVRLGGKKVGGILINNSLAGDTSGFSILGVGVNVNLDPNEYPEIKDIATSVRQELGHPVSRLALLGMLLDDMERLYISINEDYPIREEWSGLLDTLAHRVQVTWKEQSYEGYAQGVDEEGSLILRRADGSLQSFPAGEVTLQK